MGNKFYFIYSLFAGAVIFFLFNAHNDGAYSNTGDTFSGAPGDLGTCYFCHVEYTDNSGPGTLEIEFNNDTNWYEPGKTYNVTVSIKNHSSSRNGFQATSVTNVGNNGAGSFLPPSDTDTFNVSISGSVRNYIEHNTLSSSGSWTLQWKAPATNSGDIKMYVSGVVGAGFLNSTQGDYPYSTTLMVKPLVLPVANFSADKTIVCQGDTITFTSTSTAAFTYSWSFSSGKALGTSDSIVQVVATQSGNIDADLTVTNSLGQDTETKSNFIIVAPAPNISFTRDHVSCYGKDDGCITVSGGGGYDINWSNSATGTQICNLAPGNYCVTVTDPSSGCAVDTCFIINQPTEIKTTATSKDLSCHESGDGSASVTATGGNSPYNYLWSNGSAINPTNLPAGKYYVTVTDGSGCEKVDSVTIDQPPAILLDTTITHTTTGSDGAIDLSVSGGNPPYDYEWSNGSWMQDLNYLSGGEYCVTVTDDNDCTESLCVWVNFPVGLPTLEGNNIIAYPNPARDRLHLATSASEVITEVELLNAKGTRLLHESDIDGRSVSLDIQPLPPGIYFIRVTVDGTAHIHKLIKEE